MIRQAPALIEKQYATKETVC